MSATEIAYLEPGSPEWMRTMSASKVPAVLGLSPWESPFSMWHRMAGNVGPVEENDAMRRGRYLEPAIVAWFADQHPDWTILPTATWTQQDRPWQTSTPDRLIRKGTHPVAVLECKSDADGFEWGEPLTDEVPPHVRAQAVWQMDTCDIDTCHVALINGHLVFSEYVITYDADEAAMIRERAEAFLASIDAGQAPPIDSHSATYQAVKELHPDIDGEDVDVTNDIARRFIAAKALAKQVETEVQLATSLVADAMGSAQRAKWDGQVIARRQAKKGGIPYLVAAKNLPDLTPAATTRTEAFA